MAPRTRATDPMGGAIFQSYAKDKTPEDFMDDPETGMRPGQTAKPSHSAKADLRYSIGAVNIPPRTIWNKGKWKNQADVAHADYTTWVTDGQGTPGNYKTREYQLPHEVAFDPTPKHPSSWKKRDFDKKDGFLGTGKKTTTTKSQGSSLPFGIRFRCPGCGHWWKEMDLPGHAQVCPAKEGGESDWAIECQCCVSLDDTSKCKPGYPKKKPEPKPEAKAEKTEAAT